MRVLLDENFPLRLLRELRFRGIECDHIIELGLRGLPDSEILARVETEPDVVLLTQDGDFEHAPLTAGRIVISRVSQGLPLQARVDLWVGAIESLRVSQLRWSVIEVTPAGELRTLRP